MPLTTIETELDYYHQKVNNQVAEIPKKQTLKVLKSVVKDSIYKPIILNFLNLSTIFCGRLFEEATFHF